MSLLQNKEVIDIKENGGILYFIENIDTGLWYYLSPNTIRIRTHTFGKVWDYPPPGEDDYWTSDSMEAMGFLTKNEAEEMIELIETYKNLHLQNYDREK